MLSIPAASFTATASLRFYSKLLCVLVSLPQPSAKAKNPWKAITVSPHHAAPTSPQIRHDRHINTPSHPIEHSVQREEGNGMNVEECNRLEESDQADSKSSAKI